MRRLAIAFSLCFAAAFPLHAAITGTLVNGEGQPVAGAKVSIFALETPDAQFARISSATPDRTPLASATSDAKGKFSIESPKDAVVTLGVSAAGYAPVAMAVERDEEHGAILLMSASMKQGRLTAGGKPVAGAKVLITGNGGESVATTDAEGRYSVPDPERWAMHLIIVHPDFASVDEMNTSMEARKFASERTLDPGVAINGRVVAEDGKTPVAGATIRTGSLDTGKTAADGTFTIAHAPRNWTTIAARGNGIAGERARTNESGAITIRAARTANVSGIVTDAKTHAPLAGVEVHLSGSRRFMAVHIASAFTDAKGAYSLSAPAGAYQLAMSRPGYIFANVSVTAAASAKVTKNIAATQLARVTGTVVDENKGAVAGTRLEAGSVARESGLRMFRNRDVDQSAITGPDGAFVMRVEPDTDVQIEAKKKGYPEARSSTLHFAAGERKAGLVLTIPLGVAVTGQVVDKNGKGITGAAITATESRTGGGPRFTRRMMRSGDRSGDDNVVKTAADGSFAMRLKPGTYDFRVKREGYASKNVAARQVGTSTQPIAVTLEPGAQLSGRVTRGGAGIEGVSIDLFGEDNESHAETAADGSFHLADLTPGQVMISAQKQDDFIQQFRPVTIPSEDLVIDLPAGGTISGRVVEKDTGTPVTTFDAGFANARGGGGMTFMGPPLTKHFTSDDGTFVLQNVPPGVTTLTVTAPGYATGRVQNVKVENGKTISDVEVAMEHGVRVTGRVTGPDGNALGNVSVNAMPTGAARRGPGFSTTNATTDANGEYTLENLEAGERQFVFDAPGYITTEKTATLSGTDARVDAQMTNGMKLTGVVVSDAGAPIADANVQAQTAAGSGFRSTQTDASGGFVMEGLIPGRYTFRASKTGFASGTLNDFDISSGAPARIVVQSGGTITGHITGLSADELTRVSVIAQSAMGSFSIGTVDPSGSYRIDGAPTGTVRLRGQVQAAGLFAGRNSPQQSVQVDPGGSAQADIAFPTGVVQGRVTRDGVASSQVMVMFVPQRGSASTNARVMTDNSGNYQAVGLEDATYDVQVIDMNSTPYTTTYTVSGGSGTFNIDIRSAPLRGRVTDASTGQPINEAVIQLRPSGDANSRMPLRVAPTVSDASGSFTIDSVPPGTYNLGAEKDGYGAKAVDVTVGDSGANVDIQLAPNAGVSLRIVDARDGRPLSAFVRVMNMSNAVVYDSPFRFTSGGPDTMNLPLDAGTYRMIVYAQGYAAQNVMISAPSTQTIAMTPGGSIAIKSNGSAMRRARLLAPDGTEYVRGFGGSIFAVDPSPGTTILQNIAPGTYTLQILDSSGAPAASTQVTVTEGQVAQASL